MGGRAAYRVLVEKPDGKRQLGRPRSGWKSKINIDFQEVDGEWALTGLIWFGIGTGSGPL
jgi:hypothetical protein